MAVRIRLTRRGRKKLAIFDVIVADSRSPRDGRFIEKLGTYNPNTKPSTVELNEEKAFDWLMKGALPTETVRNILSDRGIMLKKHLQIGVLKGAIKQEDADEKLGKWKADKEATLAKQMESLASAKSAKDTARLEAERKVSEKRAEALRKRQAELAPAPVAEEQTVEEHTVEEQSTVEEQTAEEQTVEEQTVEEETAKEELAATEEPQVAKESVAPESGEKLEPETPEQVAPSQEPPASENVAPESGEKPEALDDAEEKEEKE